MDQPVCLWVYVWGPVFNNQRAPDSAEDRIPITVLTTLDSRVITYCPDYTVYKFNPDDENFVYFRHVMNTTRNYLY